MGASDTVVPQEQKPKIRENRSRLDRNLPQRIIHNPYDNGDGTRRTVPDFSGCFSVCGPERREAGQPARAFEPQRHRTVSVLLFF
jgi:hypothetical protein